MNIRFAHINAGELKPFIKHILSKSREKNSSRQQDLTHIKRDVKKPTSSFGCALN
jgi:hypothetical protein